MAAQAEKNSDSYQGHLVGIHLHPHLPVLRRRHQARWPGLFHLRITSC